MLMTGVDPAISMTGVDPAISMTGVDPAISMTGFGNHSLIGYQIFTLLGQGGCVYSHLSYLLLIQNSNFIYYVYNKTRGNYYILQKLNHHWPSYD